VGGLSPSVEEVIARGNRKLYPFAKTTRSLD